MKVIVAMPAYNEEKYIGSLVLQAKRYAVEVIVVDDGSSDNTFRIASLAGASVIMHNERRGKGVAIQRILWEVKLKDVEVLVILDADYQHNPNEIPQFIEAVHNGYDFVIGSRKLQEGNIPRYRRLGQRVLGVLSGVLSRKDISDTESGFRALSKRAIEEMQLKEPGFAIESEMIAEAVTRGFKIKEIPISVTYTKNGSTVNPVKHGVSVFTRILAMISEKRPLLYFGTLGGLSIILGIATGTLVLRKFWGEGVVAIGTSLATVLLLTFGTLNIYTGVILDVLVKRIKERL